VTAVQGIRLVEVRFRCVESRQTLRRPPPPLLATFKTFARVVAVLVRLKRPPLSAFVIDNGLNLLNHGDELLRGAISAPLVIKPALNHVTPFIASDFGLLRTKGIEGPRIGGATKASPRLHQAVAIVRRLRAARRRGSLRRARTQQRGRIRWQTLHPTHAGNATTMTRSC
jgi:hypothetical protein